MERRPFLIFSNNFFFPLDNSSQLQLKYVSFNHLMIFTNFFFAILCPLVIFKTSFVANTGTFLVLDSFKNILKFNFSVLWFFQITSNSNFCIRSLCCPQFESELLGHVLDFCFIGEGGERH